MTVVHRSRAPLRISFAGGGTDVSPYPEAHGGAVLSATINMHAYAACAPRADGLVELISFDLGTRAVYPQGRVPPPAEAGPLRLLAGVARAVPVGGMTLSVRSDARPGSGLGSSSSVTVAALAVLCRAAGRTSDGAGLAELAYRVEREECAIAGGRQDQYAAVFGGLNFIEFGSGPAVVTPLAADRRTVLELEYNLLLCHTGRSRVDRNIIVNQQRGYRERRPAVHDALHGLKQLALEMRRSVEGGDLANFASLLNEGWAHKKQLAKGISDPYIDALYDAAMARGAAGGKLLGAGGGGYLLLYCPDQARHRICQVLTSMGGSIVRSGFAERGLETWTTTNS